jgi:hypothetical protein
MWDALYLQRNAPARLLTKHRDRNGAEMHALTQSLTATTQTNLLTCGRVYLTHGYIGLRLILAAAHHLQLL